MDSIFMPFFRFPDNPLLGYCLGTFVLSIACVIVGKYSFSLAFRLNKENINKCNHKIKYYQDLSIKALKAGDKVSYKACNSIANDVYGRNFFSLIALSASSLWPVFIAIGWMQYRFAGVEFRLTFLGENHSFGYVSSFIIFYLAARLFIGKIKN